MAADVDARATDAAGAAAEGSAARGRPTGREGGGEPLWRSGRGARGAGEVGGGGLKEASCVFSLCPFFGKTISIVVND